MGRIGQAVAHRARAFGLDVIYHNRKRLPEAAERMLGAQYVADLDALWTPATGDAVLVKGSQGARMERVAAALLHPDTDPADVLARQSESWRQTE